MACVRSSPPALIVSFALVLSRPTGAVVLALGQRDDLKLKRRVVAGVDADFGDRLVTIPLDHVDGPRDLLSALHLSDVDDLARNYLKQTIHEGAEVELELGSVQVVGEHHDVQFLGAAATPALEHGLEVQVLARSNHAVPVGKLDHRAATRRPGAVDDQIPAAAVLQAPSQRHDVTRYDPAQFEHGLFHENAWLVRQSGHRAGHHHGRYRNRDDLARAAESVRVLSAADRSKPRDVRGPRHGFDLPYCPVPSRPVAR